MTRSIAALAAAAFVASASVASARAAADSGARCAVPPDLIAAGPSLPALSKRFRDHQPVVIVAVGGASTDGVAAGGPARAYPHWLGEALERRHPGVPITVLNRSVLHQTAHDMVAGFAADVLPAKPNLVIWETGTIDAVRAVKVDHFASALKDGIATLHAAGAAVMLVNMQYNSRLNTVIDFRPYLDVMRRVADTEDVDVFRRYAIMRYWSDNDRFKPIDVSRGNQTVLATAIYRCLGRAMADAIDRAAR